MLETFIPIGKRDAVRHALRAVFGDDAIEALSPVRAGLSGALVCKVVVGGKAGLLRVQREIDTLRDPARQYACMTAAAEAGLAPALLHADADNGVAIMQFIETQPVSDYVGGGPALVLALGGLIARLQRTPVFPRLVDYFDGMEGVVSGMLATGILSEDSAREPLAAYREICTAYPRIGAETWVSSHNDLNPSNILYDGDRLWLVDWEAAFAADRHVDPAMLANWFGLQGAAEAAFLAAVFGEVDDVVRARFLLMRQVCNMFVACMMLDLAAGAGATHIVDLDGPSLADIRNGLRTGTFQIGATDNQVAFAKAALREVSASVQGVEFAKAARVLA